MTPEMIEALKKPFGGTAVGKLPKIWCVACRDPKSTCQDHKRQFCKDCNGVMPAGHLHLSYVGHAHVTERLWEVDPDWNWEPVSVGQSGLPMLDDSGGLWIRLTIGGKTQLGYGHAGNKRGGDAVKETIGDAIRNAAMRFQIALDMWKKDQKTDNKTPAVTHEEQPAAELSREQVLHQVKLLGRTKQQMDLPKLVDDFAHWSKGQHDLKDADVAVLVQYRNHLQGSGS